uniref:Secretion regulating guanine nucleotide exchange factor n=1 Tax=Crocodylus porosus TaxID=8502 RepID=A0A7M4F2F3_CROPO
MENFIFETEVYSWFFLFEGGELFTWGNNSHGQLGSGSQITFLKMPQLVKDLQGIPVAQIAAGGAHCLVLSLSGAVYSWGKNSFGQLGLGHTKGIFDACEQNTEVEVGMQVVCW